MAPEALCTAASTSPRLSWTWPSGPPTTARRSPVTGPESGSWLPGCRLWHQHWCCWRHRAACKCHWSLPWPRRAVPLVVVNPHQVRDFRLRHCGQLAKTAALDTAILAHFAAAVRPPRAPAAGRRDPGAQLPSEPPVPGTDDASGGAQSPRHHHQRRASPHRSPHRLAGAAVGRPGAATAADAPVKSGVAREGRSAVQRPRRGPPTLPHPVGPSAGIGHAGPPADPPPWWGWRPATGTVARCAVSAPSGVVARGCAPPATGARWSPVPTIP